MWLKERSTAKVFKKEQERYRQEGIKFDNVEYANNDEVIRLIEPAAVSGGEEGANILSLIQDEARLLVSTA